MPWTCFSYSADMPGIRTSKAARPAPPGLRRMPETCFWYPVTCFSDPADVPRSMPVAPCFSYPADMPTGVRPRRAPRSAPRGLRRMPNSCFNY
jgi:hypothetical protein